MTGQNFGSIFSSKLTCTVTTSTVHPHQNNPKMKEFNLSAIFSISSDSTKSPNTKSKFWKSPRKERAIKSDGVLMCNNLEDAEVLNSLILQKVKNLKTVENLYVKDTTSFSKIILENKTIIVTDDDTYAEVFDSLNTDAPPPLPSRRASPRAPARPPYPSTMLKRRTK